MSSPGNRRSFAPPSHSNPTTQSQQHDHSYYQQLAAEQERQAAHYNHHHQQQQQQQQQQLYQQHPSSIPMPSTSPSHQPPPTSSAPPSPSRSPGKFSWGFGRSRRNSEVTSDNEAKGGNRSRKNSRSPSPNTAGNGSSFVVRSVTKQPGGVNASPNGSMQDSVSPIRRMTLEDGDGQYEREKSRPLASNLGVPSGGPGGGIGYGGKGSSNDGRPEGINEGYQNGNGIARPPSPGAISKKGFNQGMENKQKLQQASNALQQQRSRSPSPTPSMNRINAYARPLSVREREARARDYAINGGRRMSNSNAPEEGSWLSKSPNDRSSTSPLPSPSGPRNNPNGSWNVNSASRIQSTSRGAPTQNPMPASQVFSTSPSTAAISQTNAYANYSPSNPPPQEALHGLPSPVPIPTSRDRSNSRPHTPGGTSPRTPFGSVSPGGSPSLANRLIKGIFGARSPKPGDGELDGQGVYAAQDGRGEAWTDGSPLAGRSPLANRINNGEDEVEREAQLRKRSSQRQAARIVDEERRKAFETPSHSNSNGFDPKEDKPWSPRQAIESDEEAEFPVRNAKGRAPSPNTANKKGRKPVPNLNEVNHEKLPSEHDLKLMDEDQRRRVAKDVDPGDALSRLEGRLELTPAQRIIQETRSKHLAEDERIAARQAQAAAIQQQREQAQKQQDQLRGPSVQRGFDPSSRVKGSEISAGRPPTLPEKLDEGKGKGRAVDVGQEEIPVRRGSGNSPSKNATAPGFQRRQSQPGQPQSQPQSQSQPAQKQQAGANGLVPGTGPMPTQMPLNAALQELVVRFYRFERYAVPLIRSLETRLLDIERDAQMAQLQGDALSVNSNRDREMDRWVGQMTGVMKHEVGQLKAATKEIREGRELVAEVARMQGRNRGREPSASMGGSQFLNQNQSQFQAQPPSAPALKNNSTVGDSPSSTRVETGAYIQATLPSEVAHSQPRPALGDDSSIVQSPSEQSVTASQQESLAESEASGSNPATTGHSQRATNISSASFRSAVPASRAETSARTGSRAAESNSASLQRKKTLGLPPGSAPDLDKDEGKFSPKKTSHQDLQSEGLDRERERERSVSPSGRKRYTSTLGEPMRNGRISPSGDSQGQGSRINNFSRKEVLSPPSSNRFDSVGSDPRKGANMSSPSHSDTGSATSTSTAGRREISVENRLKALMAGSSPRTSSSLLSGDSAASASSSMIEQEREEEGEGEESSKIGDDYAMVASPIEETRSNRHQFHPSTSTDTTVTPARAAATSSGAGGRNDRLQASPSPNGYSSHLKTPSAASNNSGRTLSNSPTHGPVGSATPLIGGRVSPSPSRRSTSPSNFVPVNGGSNITTASHASQGLRARAQSYLQKAEPGTEGANSPRDSTLGLDSPRTEGLPSNLSSSPPKLVTSPVMSMRSNNSPIESPMNPTRALSVKKSATSFNSVGSGNNSPSGSNLRKGPPPGASLKERVAFFDTQK